MLQRKKTHCEYHASAVKTSPETPKEADQEDNKDDAEHEEDGDEVDLTSGVQEDVAKVLGQVIRNEGQGRRDCPWLDQNQAA